MVKEYFRPGTIEEALEALSAGGTALAGGTFLLAGEAHGTKPDIDRVVDLGRVLPRGIERKAGSLVVGAGATFQDLADSTACPPQLRAAAMTMANRNTRNRATVGGNLGANKSCASLIPLFLALGASVECRSGSAPARTLPAEAWLAAPEGIVLSLSVPLGAGILASGARASRTACDLATCTAAVAYSLEAGNVKGLRVALGGFGPRATLRPDLAALFEGKSLPAKEAIEAVALPLLSARADHRGSAAYKSRRGAVTLADALHAAEAIV